MDQRSQNRLLMFPLIDQESPRVPRGGREKSRGVAKVVSLAQIRHGQGDSGRRGQWTSQPGVASTAALEDMERAKNAQEARALALQGPLGGALRRLMELERRHFTALASIHEIAEQLVSLDFD